MTNELELCFRFAEPRMIKKLKLLWKCCFGDSDEYIGLFFDERFVPEQCLTAVCGDDIAGMLFLLPLTLFFALSYKFLANNELPFKKHIPGAFLSAVGWMIFSFFFALYVDNFSNYSYIYGSLTAVVLLMLWLYACMTMFLLGAQANVWFYKMGWGIRPIIKYIKAKLTKKER